jgi:uncharacterized membrane protein YczE
MPTLVPTGASLARRLLVQLAGVGLVGCGVALMIDAELGVAPYDVVTTGMHETLHLPIGLAAVLLPCVFVGLGRLAGGTVGPGTVFDLLLVSPILGLVLHALPEVHPLAVRLPMYAAGFAAIALGIVFVIVPDLGAGPAEVLMLAVADRGYPLAPVRTAIELVSVAAGWAMGGQVGAGTVAFALLIGPALRRLLTAFGASPQEAATRSDTASPGA